MPYSDAVYTAPASSWNPAVSGTPISSSDWAALLADFTGAFNNIPPYATVQAGAMNFGGIAGGTANALTLSLTPALTAYNNGLTIMFFSGAAANTTAATIAVNGLAATAVQLAGAALTGGEIAANRVYVVRYYNTVFHLFQPAAQAPLVLTQSTAGTIATLTSTDAGASQGPNLDLYRDSATPATLDILGALQFSGEDSAGNKTTYAEIVAQIVDATNGSEDANLYFNSIAAGATISWTLQSGAWTSTGQSSKGANTINAAGLYVGGHGTIAQVVRATSATYTTAATDFPVDDTIPQITEGDEILSVAITPVNASSIIRVRFSAYIGGTGASPGGCGLFVDATAAALAATAFFIDGTTSVANPKIEYTTSAGSTSARTYRIRTGPAVGGAVSVRVNGDGSSRLFGGVGAATLEVEEILPQ